jgi:drug/metabolite transporter (DMT)-like permease
MTAVPPAAPTATDATSVRGILLMLTAGLSFVLMDATAKHLSQTYPVVQVVWARYLFHMLTLPLFFGGLRWGSVVRTPRLGLQLLRSLLLLGSTFFFFLAVKHIPLATATAIGFVGPLLVTALSVPLLGETVGPRRWAAVLLGFTGVLVIIRPGLGGMPGGMHWAMALPLLVAVCFALYQISTRILSRTDGWMTTLFYSATVGLVVMTALVPFHWRTPDLEGWAWMALIGLIGGFGHLMMIKAFAAAPASTLAPFTYLQLVWSTAIGLLIFGDFPDGWTLLGAAIIAASGLYILYRERRLRGPSPAA